MLTLERHQELLARVEAAAQQQALLQARMDSLQAELVAVEGRLTAKLDGVRDDLRALAAGQQELAAVRRAHGDYLQALGEGQELTLRYLDMIPGCEAALPAQPKSSASPCVGRHGAGGGVWGPVRLVFVCPIFAASMLSGSPLPLAPPACSNPAGAGGGRAAGACWFAGLPAAGAGGRGGGALEM